jgi:hypothetical protein
VELRVIENAKSPYETIMPIDFKYCRDLPEQDAIWFYMLAVKL